MAKKDGIRKLAKLCRSYGRGTHCRLYGPCRLFVRNKCGYFETFAIGSLKGDERASVEAEYKELVGE